MFDTPLLTYRSSSAYRCGSCLRRNNMRRKTSTNRDPRNVLAEPHPADVEIAQARALYLADRIGVEEFERRVAAALLLRPAASPRGASRRPDRRGPELPQ